MDNAKRYFLDILKEIIQSIDKTSVELNSTIWYYQLYLNGLVRSVEEGVIPETSDKLLKKLTRLYIDNETNCKILADTYQEVRMGYFLYKKHSVNEETA